MNKGSVSGFFGVFLIAAGLFLVFNNTGFIDFSFWEYFGDYWPVGLIIAGVAMIYKRGDAGIAVLALTLVLLFFYGTGQVGASILSGFSGFSGGSFPFGVDCVTGSGNMATDTRQLVEFTGVSARNGVNVYLERADEPEARVEAESNIIEFVKTDVKNGVLDIYIDTCIKNSKPVDIYVSFQDIRSVAASSAGRIVCDSKITGEDIEIASRSAGDVVVYVEAEDVTIDASSAGSVTIGGKADNVYADAGSSGKISAFELAASDVRVSASSAAVAEVYASKKLRADASSGGRIEYIGDAVVYEEVSSAGVVRKKS